MCSVFWLFWLHFQYLPGDWLERLLWGSITVARGSSPHALAEECLWFSWLIVLFHCVIMWCVCVVPFPTWYISSSYGMIWPVCAKSAVKHQSTLSVSLSLSLSLSLRSNGHFPGEPGLASVYWSKGWWRWWVVTNGLLEL